MPREFPTLRTARLLLRVPEASDFPRYAELLSDPQASRHIGGPLSRAAAWRRFLQMPGAWLVQGYAMFSVIELATGRWLGQAGPWQPEGWNGTEVGYSFHPDAWGRGFAFEAASACVDYAFAVLGWKEVIQNIAPDNHASIRLALRLGAVHRGPGQLPDPFADHPVEVYGQTRAMWETRRS